MFARLWHLVPIPPRAVQIGIAIAVLLSQAGIAVTGSIVRVTSSGLGCPTWPQCFPGSFVPESHQNVASFHQAIEFGNRLLTFAVVITAALIVIAVHRASRRREVKVYAWLMPASTIVQAVIGGITVRTGLLWWTVSVHLVVSMIMVWLSTLLLEKVREPDDGERIAVVPNPLRWLALISAALLSAVLIAGTMVTGAGPHAGDKSADKPVPRLEIAITTLVHAHAELVVAYMAIIVALGFALAAVGARPAVRKRLYGVLALVVVQAAIGFAQYLTGVPAVLVVLHVAGAGACVAATAALWVAMRPQLALDSAATPSSAAVSTT